MVEEAIVEEGRTASVIRNLKSDKAVFIGYSPVGPLYEPQYIKRWGQFIVKFGGFKKAGYIAWGVSGFLQNGGKECYVVNTEEFPKIEDPPERPEGEEATEEALKEWEIQMAEWEANKMIAIEEINARVERGLESLEGLWDEIGMIAIPGVYYKEVHELVTEYAKKHEVFAILDGPEEKGNGDVDELPEVKDVNSLVYFPWIYSQDLTIGRDYVSVPPSGYIAGLFVSLRDEEIMPDSVNIKGALGLKYKLSSSERAKVKEKGINPIVYIQLKPGIVLSD
jgi:hypothetical protein